MRHLEPQKCPECGSVELSQPDDEGLIDCCECGIWFIPKHPENAQCFDDEGAD